MRFAVVGSPVTHSKSPKMHAAAYRALGLDHTYEAIDADEAGFASIVQALREGKLQGLNVTVPHKLRALALADEIAESAADVGAANTLVRNRFGKIVAYNTDAEALKREIVALVDDAAVFVGTTAVVVGTGGAARAALFAFRALGVARVVVAGRRPDGLAGGIVVAHDLARGPVALPDVGIVVQATTSGMAGGAPGSVGCDAIDWSRLRKNAVAVDAVYGASETPFVATAKAAGLRVVDGRGMLARQGALAFELWLGIPAPFAEMRAALDA